MGILIKIASDIDGCLNLFTQRLAEVIEENFDVKVNKKHNDYEILQSLGIVSPDDRHQFWLKFQDEVDKCKSFPLAAEVINKLRLEGFHITLITARGFHISTRTENWLKNKGYSYDDIIFNAGTKADACKWKSIDVMIEDLPENILALANKGIKVIVPKHSYNEHVLHENVIHCNDWEEIYREIKSIYSD